MVSSNTTNRDLKTKPGWASGFNGGDGTNIICSPRLQSKCGVDDLYGGGITSMAPFEFLPDMHAMHHQIQLNEM